MSAMAGGLRARWAKRRGARRAFTLIEVLLATALFSVAILSLAWAYIGILHALDSVKVDHALNEEMRWLRERVLSEGDREALAKGGAVKSLDLGEAQWSVSIVSTNVVDLFQIEMMVAIGEGEKRREKVETMQVLRPTWSEAVERGKLIENAKTQVEADRRDRGIVSSARSSGTRRGGGNR